MGCDVAIGDRMGVNLVDDSYTIAGKKSGTYIGTLATAEGMENTSNGNQSHAEGAYCKATGNQSHAEGYETTASGSECHSEGNYTTAIGWGSHAEGDHTTARGYRSHAEGSYSVANGDCSHASGLYSISNEDYQTTIGCYNIIRTKKESLFTIGNGTNQNNAMSNAYRISFDGKTYAGGSYSSSGADYAEMFEWQDRNSENIDRVGRFVTLNGEYISLATPNDTDILGVVSGAPSVLGDIYDDQWQGMYLTDIYGRTLWEEIDRPAEVDPEGNEIIPARKETHMKLNPDYDNTQEYIPRSKRPEWDAVGLLGKLVMLDDGTAEVNGYVKSSYGGIATKSNDRTRFRVMSRLDENHIKVLIL